MTHTHASVAVSWFWFGFCAVTFAAVLFEFLLP